MRLAIRTVMIAALGLSLSCFAAALCLPDGPLAVGALVVSATSALSYPELWQLTRKDTW